MRRRKRTNTIVLLRQELCKKSINMINMVIYIKFWTKIKIKAKKILLKLVWQSVLQKISKSTSPGVTLKCYGKIFMEFPLEFFHSFYAITFNTWEKWKLFIFLLKILISSILKISIICKKANEQHEGQKIMSLITCLSRECAT